MSVARRRVLAFVRLSRLAFLGGGLAAGAYGTAFAAYGLVARVDWGAYALAQGTVTAFHLMTHYANEYFDHDGDAVRDGRATFGDRTPFSGGSGALVDGSLPATTARTAATVAAACGGLGIAALVASGRGAAAAMAVAIAALAWSYSAPPLRLCARGLGELTTALVVAVLVPLCTYAAQGGPLDARAFAGTVPGAAAMFAMMLAVEAPDAAVDAATGKRTLLVRLGDRARTFGVAATTLTYAATFVALGFGAPPGFVAFELLTAPAGLDLARAFRRRGDDAGLAARGVAFYFVVTLFAALAYAAAPHRATIAPAAAVMRPW